VGHETGGYMAQFDAKKFSPKDWILLGCAGVTVIALFLPWEAWSVGGFSGSQDGWATGFLGWFGALLIIAAGAYLILDRMGVDLTAIKFSPALVELVLAGVGSLLVLIKALTLPSATYAGFGISWGPSFGLFLALIAGVVEAALAFMAFRSAPAAAPPATPSPGTSPPA
jgi:hypothetical protein